MPGEPGHRREHGRRRGQDQGARAGHDQDRDRPRPGVGPSEDVAGRDRQEGDHLHHRQEVTGVAVGRPLERGLAVLRLGHHAEDLSERRLVPDLLGADLDQAELVDRPGVDRVAGPLVDRQRLARQGGLIDGRASGQDRPIHRDPLAGADDHEVADDDLTGRDFHLDSLAADAGGARGLVEQAVDRALGPFEGDRFEHLTDQGDEDDLGRDERLPDHQRGQARLRQRDVGADASLDERLDRPVDDPARSHDRRDPDERDPRGPGRWSPPQPAEDEVAADQDAEDRRQRVERLVVVMVVVVFGVVMKSCLWWPSTSPGGLPCHVNSADGACRRDDIRDALTFPSWP